jgi:hypothetical protein
MYDPKVSSQPKRQDCTTGITTNHIESRKESETTTVEGNMYSTIREDLIEVYPRNKDWRWKSKTKLRV